MEIVLFGIVASILSELISVAKKALSNTPFEGSAAQLVVILLSILGAIVKLAYGGTLSFSFNDIFATASQVWALAEGYYLVIGQWYATHAPSVPATLNPLNR